MVGAVDHDAVECDALFGPIERARDVLVRGGVVEMHGDGHRCRMARVEAELDKRLAELRHGHGEELAERRRACFFRRADERDDRLRIVARLRIDRVSALVGRLQDAQREVVRVIHRHCLEEITV